jgi:hypothetical protein
MVHRRRQRPVINLKEYLIRLGYKVENPLPLTKKWKDVPRSKWYKEHGSISKIGYSSLVGAGTMAGLSAFPQIVALGGALPATISFAELSKRWQYRRRAGREPEFRLVAKSR